MRVCDKNQNGQLLSTRFRRLEPTVQDFEQAYYSETDCVGFQPDLREFPWNFSGIIRADGRLPDRMERRHL